MNTQGGLMGGLFVLCEWFMKFAVANLLWIVFNFPIVFLGLNLLFAPTIELMLLFLIPIAVLMPFLFFPATTAMFGMVRDWIINEGDNHLLVKTYWKYYKENYKRSMINGLFLTAIWLVWAVDVYFFYNVNILLFILFLTMGIVLFVFTVNLFSVTVHYVQTFRESIKNAFLITVGSPMLFLTIAMSSGIVLYMSFNVLLFLIPFFTGSLIAFLSFSAFYRLYLKIKTKHAEVES